MDKLIVANHKNYMNINLLSKYIRDINNFIDDENVIICPSNIYLPYFLKHKYKVGIQNVAVDSDTCTGEITSSQAAGIGIKYAIIGHSERRMKMGEDNKCLNQKVINALSSGLEVILCVGETAYEKKHNKTKKVIYKQLKECLKDIKDLSNIIIAYEPVWAIGTGTTPTNDAIKEMMIYIKKNIKDIFAFDDIKVLYGGSVSAKNIEEIKSIDELDGFLIGKASTDSKEFLYMIEVVRS